MSALPDFFQIISAAEGDMRKVYDHAFLLHDHLSRAGTLTEDEQGALVWPAGDLLKAGDNLRSHCDAMYEAAQQLRAVDRPKLSDEPIVQPDKLSVEAMYSLFDALGTVCSVMDGMLCQPRFTSSRNLNKAGEMLDRIQEVLHNARDDIRREALSRKGLSDREVNRLVFFATEEWTDGSCAPQPALKGITTALTDLGKAVAS